MLEILNKFNLKIEIAKPGVKHPCWITTGSDDDHASGQ